MQEYDKQKSQSSLLILCEEEEEGKRKEIEVDFGATRNQVAS